jgi:hypothetical protein
LKQALSQKQTTSVLPLGSVIAETIQKAAERVDRVYAMAFRERHATEPDTGWDVLGQVFDFLFRPQDAAAPFHPMLVMDGKRSMIPDDLDDDQLNALAETLKVIDDPEYRARVCDVLWLRRRNPAAARDAVAAYLASGARLEDLEHWVPSLERLERAVRLARQVEPKGELPRRVLSHLEARVLHFDGEDPSYFSLKAMEILDEFKFGDSATLANISGRIADASCSSGDFERARCHYAVQARFLRRAGQVDEAEAALCIRAECYVQEAESQELAGSYIAARHFWEAAEQAFRNRPSLRTRLPQVRDRLVEAGRRTLQEMKTATTDEFDISDEINAVQSRLRGLAWDDAFFQFALLLPLIDPAKLRQDTIDHLRSNPLQSFIKADIFDYAGRKIAVRPPLGTGDSKQEDAAIEGFMDEGARIQRHLLVHAFLAPAVRVMKDEHAIDEDAVEALIKDSEFIPDGRLSLFVKAIVAGFRFDFSTALHLLIPQGENALRHLLEQQGVVARNIDQDGVEEVWGVERVLGHEKLTAMLGDDLAYELRTLLSGRLGPNLRNLVAHGLLDENSLNGEMAFYLWWVFVRMVALPTTGMAAFVERRRVADATQA